MISHIKSVYRDGDYFHVIAWCEDMVLLSPATLVDPEEFGPALCEAKFYCDPDEIPPDSVDDLIDYLNNGAVS